MTNIFGSFIDNSSKYRAIAIFNVCNAYNKALYKYTKSFKGKIPTPVTDSSKIPNKYLSFDEYLKSKAIWKSILKFIGEKESNIDINNYLDVMIRNWHSIAVYINKPEIVTPMPNMIFSLKIAKFYEKFKEDERHQDEMNKRLAVNKSEDFYRLTPSIQSSINSLFKLKNLNPNLSFHDIIQIFVGEFDSDFRRIVLSISESDISENELLSRFK